MTRASLLSWWGQPLTFGPHKAGLQQDEGEHLQVRGHGSLLENSVSSLQVQFVAAPVKQFNYVVVLFYCKYTLQTFSVQFIRNS